MLFVKSHPLHIFSVSLTMMTLLYTVSDVSRIDKYQGGYSKANQRMSGFKPTHDELVEAVAKNMPPNLPFNFLLNNVGQEPSTVNRILPSPFDIKINNRVWQVAEFENDTFFAFGAYFDDRTLALHKGKPLVRILGLSYLHNMDQKVNLSCVFWIDEKYSSYKSIQAEVKDFLQLYPKEPPHGIDPKTSKDSLKPYLLSCPLPQDMEPPVAVSLCSQGSCTDFDNCLKIHNERPLDGTKKDLAVCVKELEYPLSNMATRLVEWIELTTKLGASKVFMYDMQVHPTMQNVLSYYSERGIIDVSPYQLAQFQINFPKELLHLQHKDIKFAQRSREQVVVHTDCLLRNIYSYKYIAVLDIDEIIMPVLNRNLKDLLYVLKNSFQEEQNEQDSEPSHYIFKNMYFLGSFGNQSDANYLSPPSEIFLMPPYLHTMRHVVRSAQPVAPPKLVKSVVSTDQVLAMYQHFPMHCLGGLCQGLVVDEGLAYLAHYRHSCSFMIDNCEVLEGDRVIDTTVWKYKDLIQDPIEETLVTLNII